MDKKPRGDGGVCATQFEGRCEFAGLCPVLMGAGDGLGDVRSAAPSTLNYTALRPQLVTGPTPGALNVLPAIGVYAAIRREKGEPAFLAVRRSSGKLPMQTSSPT